MHHWPNKGESLFCQLAPNSLTLVSGQQANFIVEPLDLCINAVQKKF